MNHEFFRSKANTILLLVLILTVSMVLLFLLIPSFQNIMGLDSLIKNKENQHPINEVSSLSEVSMLELKFEENLEKSVAKLELNDELAEVYRQSLRNAFTSKPDFSRHYSVATLGCGSGCAVYIIVDNNTGYIYDSLGLSNDFGTFQAEKGWTPYSLDSNLISVVTNAGKVVKTYNLSGNETKHEDLHLFAEKEVASDIIQKKTENVVPEKDIKEATNIKTTVKTPTTSAYEPLVPGVTFVDPEYPGITAEFYKNDKVGFSFVSPYGPVVGLVSMDSNGNSSEITFIKKGTLGTYFYESVGYPNAWITFAGKSVPFNGNAEASCGISNDLDEYTRMALFYGESTTKNGAKYIFIDHTKDGGNVWEDAREAFIPLNSDEFPLLGFCALGEISNYEFLRMIDTVEVF